MQLGTILTAKEETLRLQVMAHMLKVIILLQAEPTLMLRVLLRRPLEKILMQRVMIHLQKLFGPTQKVIRLKLLMMQLMLRAVKLRLLEDSHMLKVLILKQKLIIRMQQATILLQMQTLKQLLVPLTV